MGKPHPEDREWITPPSSLLYIYGWFWECAQGRPLGPEGVSMPIPSTEILAWATLNGLLPHAWELQAMRALDGCFLRVSAEKGA